MAVPAGNLERVRALAVCGRTLAIGGVRASAASQLTFYDHVGQKPEVTVDLPAHVLALASDDAGFVAACADGILRWFDKAGKSEREVPAHTGAANAVAIQGDLLASAGADGVVRLWSRKTGAKYKPKGATAKGAPADISLSSRPLRAVAIDPEGGAVAGAGDDGVVRVVSLADAATRDMPGHDGPVLALLFTPADGRLASGGEDGTTRLWYLAGEVEADVRGKDDTGHAGGTTAIAFLPSKNREEVGERFFTAGVDGKLRLWRTSERRKPRTFETKGAEPLYSITIATIQSANASGCVYCAGDARTVFGFGLDSQGQPEDKRIDLANGFDVLGTDLHAQAMAKREATVKTLASLGEPEALELVLRALATGEPSVRALAASELGRHGRTGAKRALRERLDDENHAVRAAAFASLRTLESSTPLTALRAGLGSKFADTRTEALRALPPLFATSPLVQGLIAAHLADPDASVRRAAVAQLLLLHPSEPAVPLRAAFERGAADVRCEVLVRGALGRLLGAGVFAPVVGKALDDEDADVRRVAFVVNTLGRPALLAWLEARDEAFGRALADVLRRVVEVKGGKPPVPGADEVISTVKSISTHFVTFEHPTLGEVSIFKPNLHTPIKPRDPVRLINVRSQDKRADDYIVGDAPLPTADLDAIRLELVGAIPAGAKGAPTDADREPLLAALACRTPDTSLRGARGLALFGDMRALGALLTISREPDPGLRREAVFALVALEDRRAERRLAWMLSDPVASVRDAALTCYAKLESDPLSVAATALQSAHDDMRVRGLDILVKQGKDNPRAEALLQSALEDEASNVRAEAFRTLWAWHTKDPFSPLDRALEARFPDLRLRAVQELAAIAKHKEGGREAQAAERLFKAIGDRDWSVAKAAYDGTVELRGKFDIETHLAALGSSLAQLRVLGASDSAKAASAVQDRRGPLSTLRSPLTKLLEDKEPTVRIAAIETLDVLVSDDLGPLYVGLQSSFLDLRVRSAELLSARRDEQIISPMQSLIADKELLAQKPQIIAPLRHRAATALANLGTPKLLRYFATDLIKDEDGGLREQASRGVSNASRRGEEGYLLDLLGHADIAVRSWAGEGLARLGDARAVPVLTGTLRHDHPPIRIGAIVSFAALGPEGHGGMLQGLEDPSREVQRIVLSVILARDLRAFRKGEPPELLATALSSQRPEVRFAAARAIELRMLPEQYAAHLVEVLMPEKPEKAEELARWPDESTRARLMIGLAEALAGDRPEQRYAAAQALRLHDRPEVFFREVQRAVRPRSSTSPWVPETAPGGGSSPPPREPSKKGPLGLLRRLFASGPEAAEDSPELPEPKTTPEEQQRLRLLAFGAYVGLLRQSASAAAEDEGHRVRRDAIDRVVELVKTGTVSTSSATPALARALDDPNHLVRRAALGALRAVYTNDPEAPLTLALASSASDVVRAALDELALRGPDARPRIVKALDSDVTEARRYAFELLEKSAPKGSLEPLLAALGSAHADLRIGVLERLATSQDPRVVAALGKALESDHEDLRLRAAELLAGRARSAERGARALGGAGEGSDERAVDVLGACLRTDDDAIAARAREALARIGTPAAVGQLAARADEVADAANAAAVRIALAAAIGKSRGGGATAIDALAARFSDDDESVRAAAVAASLEIIGPRADTKPIGGEPKPRAPDQALALRFCEAGTKSRFPDVRLAAAERLDDVTDASADALLVGLFGDRSVEVRARAVLSYALRVEKKGSSQVPLVDVIRAGGRETMLSAAVGLSCKTLPDGAAAFRPLLLFVRAGEAGERERALLGLGTLGDVRALAELETIASGGTEEAPVEESMQAAALEALGRLHGRITDSEAKERVRDRVESSVASKAMAMAVAAAKALRWIADGRARARIEGILASGTTSPERLAAAEALGELKDPASELVLAKALDDDDGHVRDAARAALDLIFPTERTRVELLAVESEHEDVSEPAAAFLAAEGDAAKLLEKLAKISSEALRERLRYGLARRASLPGAALATLLGEGTAAARADAAWVVGVALRAIAEAERASIGKALVRAAQLADQNRREAARRGKSDDAEAETTAAVNAVWSARLIGVSDLRAVATKLLDDTNAPIALRVQAARALGAAASGQRAEVAAEDIVTLQRALGDPDLAVRGEAASSLGNAKVGVESAKRAPLDPVVLGRIARAQTLPMSGYEKADTRRVVAPVAIGTRNVGPLLAHAKAKNPGRLEAIAELGLSTTEEAISLLQSLAAKSSGEPEDVRKAAFRALRRAQRRLAKEVRP
jgi:ParB family chromosome partitioning protein